MRILVFTVCLILLLASVSTAKILVASYVAEGVKSIVVMEDDGTEIKTIHTGESRQYLNGVRWSPDGKQIVFYRFRKPGDWQWVQIVAINSDGTNERILTQTQGASDRSPVFSPDGKSVLFVRSMRVNDELERGVCILNLESGNIKKITDFGVNFPDWSPDGKQIVYSNIPVLGKDGESLWVMDADGRNPRDLLPKLPQGEVLIMRGAYARWSPNGKQVVYDHYEAKFNPNVGFIPQANLYFIYDFSTRKTEQLQIPKTYFPSALDWMDNGKSILFSAREVELKVPGKGVIFPYRIYKYDIVTKRITPISEQTWLNPSLDWISDDVFPVTPKGKKQTRWGLLKLSLPEYREAYKLLLNCLSSLMQY